MLFNADYNHTFQGGGWHTLKGGFGIQNTENDVQSMYPGGYGRHLLGHNARTGRAGTRHGCRSGTTR